MLEKATMRKLFDFCDGPYDFMLIENILELTEFKMLGSRITMHLQNIDQQAAHLELVRLQHKDRQCAYGPFVCCP
jgi:hypothetical protein